MTELGLDSIRNGEERQAASVASQIETAFTAGCAGVFAYAWTDEWHRGGEEGLSELGDPSRSEPCRQAPATSGRR